MAPGPAPLPLQNILLPVVYLCLGYIPLLVSFAYLGKLDTFFKKYDSADKTIGSFILGAVSVLWIKYYFLPEQALTVQKMQPLLMPMGFAIIINTLFMLLAIQRTEVKERLMGLPYGDIVETTKTLSPDITLALVTTVMAFYPLWTVFQINNHIYARILSEAHWSIKSTADIISDPVLTAIITITVMMLFTEQIARTMQKEI